MLRVIRFAAWQTVRWRFWYQLEGTENGCCCGLVPRSRSANSKAAAKLHESTFDCAFHELLCATRWRRARDSSLQRTIRMNISVPPVSDKCIIIFIENILRDIFSYLFKFLIVKRAILLNFIKGGRFVSFNIFSYIFASVV